MDIAVQVIRTSNQPEKKFLLDRLSGGDFLSIFKRFTLHNCEAAVNESDDPPRIALICLAREVLRGRSRNSMSRRAWEIPDVEFRVFRVCE